MFYTIDRAQVAGGLLVKMEYKKHKLNNYMHSTFIMQN